MDTPEHPKNTRGGKVQRFNPLLHTLPAHDAPDQPKRRVPPVFEPIVTSGPKSPLESTLEWGEKANLIDDPRFATAVFLAEQLRDGGSNLAQIAHEWRSLMDQLRGEAEKGEDAADATDNVIRGFRRAN